MPKIITLPRRRRRRRPGEAAAGAAAAQPGVAENDDTPEGECRSHAAPGTAGSECKLIIHDLIFIS